MGLVKVDQENSDMAVLPPKGGKSSLGKPRKSLIPKLSMSPSNNENASPATVGDKVRRPLAPMQNVDSPTVRKSTGKLAPRKSENVSTPVKAVSVEKAVGTDQETSRLSASSQLQRAFPGTPQNSPNKVKGKKSSVGGKVGSKSGDDESVAYWKELAESRRQALEIVLQENYELHKKVEKLERDNAELQEIAKEAETLAVMVNQAAEDIDSDLDESGIGDGAEGTAV